jgi:hypothetical protein
MAKVTTYYALSKLSGPAGFILPGSKLDALDADSIEQLVADGLATDDADLASHAEAGYVGAPEWGTTTGGIEVVEEDVTNLPLPIVAPDITTTEDEG